MLPRVPRKPDRIRRRGAGGFTLVELLTVVALVAVLATLTVSALAAARTRSQQVTCGNNLRQIALAVEIYHDDTGRRPRSLTRLTTRPTWIAHPRSLICPGDPARRTDGSTNAAWGNLANHAQEPAEMSLIGTPEERTWEAELRETAESVAFSYLHPLAWRREAWQRLTSAGNQVGVAVCQLHGVRVPGQASRPHTAYEGRTLRAQRDGAVVVRKIFRTAGASPPPAPGGTVRPQPADGALTVGTDRPDYPWEFYTDTPPPPAAGAAPAGGNRQ